MNLNTFKVYQISPRRLDQERFAHTDPNSEAEIVRVYRDLMTFGPEEFKPELFEFFDHCATIKTVGEEDVYRMMNIGPALDEEYEFEPNGLVRSLSVGDIVYNESTGEYRMVADFGFETVEVA